MSNIIKAIQEIYPDIKGGYAYWESRFDGTPLEKPEDGLVWENKEYEKPLWVDIEDKLKIVELKQVKEEKLVEIQTAKEIDLYLNVSYNNKDFISSEKAVSNMTGAIILDQDDYNWLDANGNPNIMTVNDLRNLIGIIATQRSLIYNKEALKIKAVNDSQTIEEVSNINWKDNLSLGRKTKKTIKSI